jgi:RNA polymerase sigma factor (sigma-70 family)
VDDTAAPAIMETMTRGVDDTDDRGFEELFLAQFRGVARTVRYIVGDARVAEEITQDAFVQLYRSWGRVARYDRPDLWVRRVAIRQAQRERHRAWQRPALELRAAGRHVVPGVVPGPVEPRDDVLAAVRALPGQQRAVVVLSYFEDRPMPEIAGLVGCSVSTGWSHLHNARKRLAAVLGEEVTDDVR